MYYEERKKDRQHLITYIFMIITISLLSILILKSEGNTSKSDKVEYNAEKMELLENEDTEKDDEDIAVEKAVKCIVGISKLKQAGSSIFVNNAETKLGLGSGVVITDNGYILTNQHVVGNKFSSCFVTLEDGKSYDGNVVWADSNIDLAIVKINKGNLDYLNLADSDKLKIAEEVYAIGNPIGMEFQRTITKGIISGLNRTIQIQNEKEAVYMEDLIQTDATINEGNSGGALINENGELIGINSVKISDAEGIGFAVPVNIIKPIINRLVNDGTFNEAWLGIFGYDKEAIPYIDSNVKIESGIYVAQIDATGPLENSNLKVGNIITKIDDTKINKMNDLKKYIYSKKPGDDVRLYVQNGQKEILINVTLGEK